VCNKDVDPNRLALYILLVIVAASVCFLVWVFFHLDRELGKKS